MMFLDPHDSLAVLHCKLALWNIRTYLDMTTEHRAEIDRAIEDCWRRWDAITNTKEAV